MAIKFGSQQAIEISQENKLLFPQNDTENDIAISWIRGDIKETHVFEDGKLVQIKIEVVDDDDDDDDEE